MARGRLAAVIMAGGSLAGAAAFLRRRLGRGGDRVEVYFADGSSVTFGESSPEAARLLPIAARILAQSRS